MIFAIADWVSFGICRGDFFFLQRWPDFFHGTIRFARINFTKASLINFTFMKALLYECYVGNNFEIALFEEKSKAIRIPN